MFKKKPTNVYNHHSPKSNHPKNTEPALLSIFPKWRMLETFPWQVWALGWLAIFKGVLWLATDPNVPSPLRETIGIKNLLFMIPFIILGIGIWNLKKWAVWGVILLAVIDLFFFILYPQLSSSPISYAKLIQYIMGKHFFILQFILLLCNGPLGSILILFASNVMLQQAGKIDMFTKQRT